jgi:hypothetical protein
VARKFLATSTRMGQQAISLPPPPTCCDDADSDDSSAKDTNNEIGDLHVPFPRPPPSPNEEDADIFDPQESITRASTVRDKAARRMTGSKDAPDPVTAAAIQRTFNPDNMLERALLPKCVEAGVSDVHSRMNNAEMKLSVRKFFIELHDSEGANLHESDCYVGKAQAIERKRKQPAAQKRKSKFAAASEITQNGSPSKVSQPAKKKGLSVRRTTDKFPN